MVIDDSHTIRRTTEALLKKAGYEVFTAADGFEAMSMITDNHPDIIFVDIMMPRLTAIRPARSSRTISTGTRHHHAVGGRLVHCARATRGWRSTNKPFTQADLIQVINKHVRKERVAS